jgi:NADH-quinone oxidoreductase subunit L
MRTAIYESLLLIPLLPLLGATLLTFFGPKMDKSTVSVVALGSVLGSFLVTVSSFWVFTKAGVPLEHVLWRWISVGRFQFDLALGFDQLSGLLMLVVTGVGFLIHLYSTEYMHDEPAYWRYFAYLNFFIFAMSVLVLGRSLPVMFIGWEGVGLASYLLIGFWYTDNDKASAGKKAFVTNRVGDFGFLIGTLTLIGLFGTADFLELKDAALAIKDPSAVLKAGIFAGYPISGVLTFACISLFVGACGKSAQLPLFVWLPDAMAGPTPVSALIHAATMVTSGVYLVCRLGFLYDLAPIAGTVVAIVGAATALFAATIGTAQNDIKKVLAYSTVSQLGYMFLAAGLGAYGMAFFHVITHAFFKACLFLGSGAVIHSLHGEQDLRKMGGLKKEIPVVYWTFLISTLALAGVAPLSGFFSKDGILGYAFHEKFPLWIVGFLGAGLTALYMSRLVCLAFYGELRAKDEHGHHVHVHAPGAAINAPLVILAVLAAIAGVLNLPHPIGHFFGEHASAWLDHFIAPVTVSKVLHLSESTEWGLMAASVTWALLGLGIGYAIFKNGPSAAMEKLTRTGAGKLTHALLYGKWFVDEIYGVLVIGPLRMIASLFSVVVDPWLIDGLGVRGSGYAVVGVGKLLSKLQTGNVQSYAGALVLAVAAFILWVLQ